MVTATSSTPSTSSTAGTGSAILTALGQGSGIDTASLITKLVAAQKAPADEVLTSRETANTARVSALASTSSGIDSFATALQTLVAGGTLFTQPTSGDTSVAAVSALAGARLGNFSSTLEVRQLAQGQTLTAAAVASPSAALGTGSFTLTNAGVTKSITLDSSNNSLVGLAAAINAANVGVSASILNDTTGARLVLKGASGARYNFTLALDAGSDGSLQAFGYPPVNGTGLSQAQAAQDASLVVDGVAVTRPTNSISDLIPGVKIDLKSAAPGTSLAIGTSFPADAITQAVTNFAAAYNELKGQLDAATAAANGSTPAGALRGDSGIRAMQQQLQKLTSTPLVSAGTGPKTLAEIGVSTQRDGTLKVDADALAAKLASDPEGVEALFNPTQFASSPLLKITSAMGKAKAGTYTLTDIAVGPPPSGTIGGVPAIVSGTSLIAAANSPAVGLVIEPQGNIASATVTVEPGLAGALQSIRDALRDNQGPLAAIQARLDAEAKAISSDRDKLDARIASYQAQLTTQFSGMEKSLSALNATKSYLDQQIKLWTNSNN